LAAITKMQAELKEHRTKSVTCDGYFHAGGMNPPQPSQIQQLKAWLAKGYTVRMITRHSKDLGRLLAVKAWCKTHFGCELPIVSQEDFEAGQ
jgi:hypothetical protein